MAGDAANLEGRHRHVFEQHARLVDDPIRIHFVEVVDAGRIGNQQPCRHRQRMAAESGKHRLVGLDAERADRVGHAECENEGNSLDLHGW